MTNFLQLHILTAYPPANLNRDDTGRPKTAIFGGQPRLRISSQSLKRAWRTSDIFQQHLKGHLAERTRLLGSDIIIPHLKTKGASDEEAEKIATELSEIFGKPGAKPGMIQQLAFISEQEKQSMLDLAEQILADSDREIDKKSILRKTDTAADLAMFGRMLADSPAYNREASVQVAHAVSTHRVTVEDDFYSAVDDLNKHEVDAGAGFIGVQEFGAGVFYVYLCIDKDLLTRNLDGNTALASSAISALLQAATQVAPKGKQNSFASHAYASYVLAELGTQQPRSLTAAFLKPVSSRGEDDKACLIEKSIKALQTFRENLAKVYNASWAQENHLNALIGEGSLQELVEFSTQTA